MSGSLLPLFQRKAHKGIIPTIPVEIQAPGAEKTVIETLPADYAYLHGRGFSRYTLEIPRGVLALIIGSATLNELPDRVKRPKHSTNKAFDKSGVYLKSPK